MGQLADRIAELMRGYGFDPSARQGELQALSSVERSEPKAAQEQFYQWKRALGVQRRSALITQLRTFPFIRDLPTHDAKGWPLKEVEGDIRDLTRALAQARDIEAAIAEEKDARGRLRERVLPEATVFAAVAPSGLQALAELAEARRRTALRETRVEVRDAAARRRAAKLAPPFSVPDTSRLPAEEADKVLATTERSLGEAEALAEAYDATVAPLRDRAVHAWRPTSEKALVREADAFLASRDVAGLRALHARTQALREEAAREASKAVRARKSGKPPPERERGAGDTTDGYG